MCDRFYVLDKRIIIHCMHRMIIQNSFLLVLALFISQLAPFFSPLSSNLCVYYGLSCHKKHKRNISTKKEVF